MFQFFCRSQQAHAVRLAALAAMFTLVASSGMVRAQSGTRVPDRGPGSATRTPAAAAAALDGYCPVSIINMKKWVRGSLAIQATYDGKVYRFPSTEQRDVFLADPAKYVPALSGDCVVCYVNMGKRVPGSVRFAALKNQRLFLFPNKEYQQEFLTNSAKYVDADLALGGKCSVCRVELGKDVQGKPEIAVIHQGLRYLFPSDQQRKMFLARPEKYAVRPKVLN